MKGRGDEGWTLSSLGDEYFELNGNFGALSLFEGGQIGGNIKINMEWMMMMMSGGTNAKVERLRMNDQNCEGWTLVRVAAKWITQNLWSGKFKMGGWVPSRED